jgi:hypothetical protein
MDTNSIDAIPGTNAASGTNAAPVPQDLRDLVAQRVGVRWEQWATAHPHLARVIDRTRLVEAAVDSLRADPHFADALRQADLDETQLAAAARVVDLAEKWLVRLLPL